MANDKKFIVKNGLLTQNNVVIGSSTDTGERLQVTGTSKFTDNMSVSGNITLGNNDQIIFGSTAYIEGDSGGADNIKFYIDSSELGRIDQYGFLVANAKSYSYQNAAGTFFTNIEADDPTANRTLTFPDASGVIWTSGNDGTGSGLDADLLDGLDSLQFVRADQSDTMDGDYVITGNLTVQGTTTTVNSETVLIADNLLTLNSNFTSGTPTENAGWEVLRGNDAASSLQWDETNDWFKLISAGTDLGRIITTADEGAGNGFDADTVDGLEAAQFLRTDVDDTANGNITILGSLTLNDNQGGAYLYMDGSGANRILYSNAGVIGFLDSTLNYAARSDADSNWIVSANTVAQMFVDADDNSYYGDFAGISEMNSIRLSGSIGGTGTANTDYMTFSTGTVNTYINNIERWKVGLTENVSSVIIKAPAYYDSNDINYFVDPAGDSELNTILLDDYIQHRGDTDTYLGFPSNDTIVLATNGTTRLTANSTAITGGGGIDFVATRFVDLDNTSYFVNPFAGVGASAVFNSVINAGDGTASIPTYSFGNATNTGMYRSSADVLAFTQGGTNRFLVGFNSGTVNYSFLDLRAPTFTDSNNTSYYGDFASTSQMNRIDIDDYIRHRGDVSTYIGFPSNDNVVIVTNGITRLTANNTHVTSTLNVYAPNMFASRFYDDDDVNYYGDFNATSQMSTIDIDDFIRHRGDTTTYFGFNQNLTYVVNTNGSNALTIDQNQVATFTSRVQIDTNPAATFGITEALRIDDNAGNNDRQLQFYELQHSGARSHRISFNTDTTGGAGYTYTQGNWGGSSTLEFANDGSIKIYSNNQVAGGSQSTITPTEIANFDYNSVNFTQDTYAPTVYIDDYIIHNGDTNTYLGFSANDTVVVATNGTVRWTANTSAITSTLNHYAPRYYTDDYLVHDGDTNTYIGFDANDSFGVWTGGTQRIDVGTYVGIGASEQTNLPLYVYHATLDTIARFTSGDNRAAIQVQDHDTSAYVLAENSLAHFGMTAYIDESNLVINATGNVGIGTVTPTEANLNISTRAAATANPFAAANKLISLQNNDTETFYWGLDNSNNNWLIGDGKTLFSSTGASLAMAVLTSSGEVVIGGNDAATYTVSDTASVIDGSTPGTPRTIAGNKLHVSGSVQLNGATDAYVIGNANATFLSTDELAFGSGGGWYMIDANKIRARNGKQIYTTGYVFGSRFYDADDGTYYVDPAGDSQMDTIDINDYIRHRGEVANTYVGFSGSDTFKIFTGGTEQVNIDNDDATFTQNVYAPKYFDKNNNSYYADFANTTASLVFAGQSRGPDGALATPTYSFGSDTNTGMFLHAADRIGFSAGGNDEFRIYTTYTLSPGESRAPLFRDSNNTAYFANPAGESKFSTARFYGGTAVWGTGQGGTQGTGVGTIHLTPSAGDNNGTAITFGAEDSGSGATAQAGIYTRTDGSYGTRMYFSTTDSYATGAKTALYLTHDGKVIATRAGMYANQFIDSNDNNYYGDFASTSIMNTVRVNQLQIDNANNYIDGRAGDYGTIRVEDLDTTWAGYAIRDDWVFMSDGAATAGIYNDTNNEWAILARQNAEVELSYNGQWEFETGNARAITRVKHYSPIYYDGNDASYFADFNAGNTSTAVKISGQIVRDNFATGDVTTNILINAQDRNHYIWSPATGWGIFWATSTSSLSYFGSTNPNELVFTGGGNVRASLDLDNGNFYAQGTGSFANLAINGGNEDLPLLKVYGTGFADTMLFDGTLYWEKRVIQPMQGVEDAATTTTSEYAKVSDGPFTSSYALRTSAYRTFYSDYIEVEPGEEIYGEISQRYISGSGGVLYYGLERFDKDKKPIAANSGTTYFIASNVNYTGTSWTTHRGHHTIPTSHTPYNGSDGGGVRYVRIRLLMNYSGGGALREFGPPILKRANVHSRIRTEQYVYAPRYYDSDDNNYYLDPNSVSKLATVDADTFRDRSNTAYYMDPVSGGNLGGNWNFNNGNITNVNAITINDPGPSEGIKWNSGSEWQIYESPNDLSTNAAGNLQFTSGTGNGTMRMRINTSGDVRAGRDMYAGRFYDTGDNNYYADPASTSVFNKLHLNQTGSLTDGTDPDLSTGLIFANSKVVTPRLVFLNDSSGDDNYITHTDSNNAYTVAGQSMGAWFEFIGDKITADNGNSAGIVASGLRSTYVEAKSNVRTPIMYDSNNTSYYSNPYGLSNLSSVLAGRYYFENTGQYMDRSYAGKGTVYVGGTQGGYGGYYIYSWWGQIGNFTNYGLYNDAYNEWHYYTTRNAGIDFYYNGSKQLETENGYALASTEMRAPIFRDSNNTSFYADPDATSQFRNLNLIGDLSFNGETFDPAPNIWYKYDANYGTNNYGDMWTRVGQVTGTYSSAILEYVFVFDFDSFGTVKGEVVINRGAGGNIISISHLPVHIDHDMPSNHNQWYQPAVVMDTDNNVWIAYDPGTNGELDAQVWFRWKKKEGISDNFAFGQHYQNVAVTYFGGGTIVKTGEIKPGVSWNITVGNAASYAGGPYHYGGSAYHHANQYYGNRFTDARNVGRYVEPDGRSEMERIDVYERVLYRSGSYGAYYDSGGSVRGYIQATNTNDEHLIVAVGNGEDIAFKDNGTAGTWNYIIRGDGNTLTRGYSYAQRFVDRDDGSYYVDPAGTSVLNNLQFNGVGNIQGVSAQGNFGQWQPHSTYSDFNSDIAYWGWNFVQGKTNAPNGSSDQWYRGRFSLGSEYGRNQDSGHYSLELAYPRYNYGGQVGQMWMRTIENGSVSSIGWAQVGQYIRGVAYAGTSHSSPIYYDLNDSNYYVDPASASKLYDLNVENRLQVKGSTPTIYTDNTYMDMRYNATGGGGLRLYDSENVLQGYWYGNGSGEHGFLDNDGNWGVRLRTGNNSMLFYTNNNNEFQITTSYTYSPGSSRAPLFYDSDNTTYVWNGAGTSYSNYYGIRNLYDGVSSGRRFTAPDGASMNFSGSSQTGAIKIGLPRNRYRSATMMSFTVNVYEYSTGRMHQFRIGGYNYSGDNNWYNVSATQLTDAARSAYVVRFGRQNFGGGNRDVVWIGETNSSWSYCQVWITDFQAGYSGFSTNWGSDWSLAIDSNAATNVSQTRTASLVYTLNNRSYWSYDIRGTIFYDNNNTGYYCNPNGTSNLNTVYINRLRLDDGGSSGHIYTDDQYLDVMYGDTGGGGMRLFDEDNNVQSYWYGAGDGQGGLLDNDGSWFLRARTGTNNNYMYCDGNAEFYVYTTYTYSPGSSRAPIFYDSNSTSWYCNPAGTSRLRYLDEVEQIDFRGGTHFETYTDSNGNFYDDRIRLRAGDNDHLYFYIGDDVGQGGYIYADDDGSIFALYHDNGEAIMYADQDYITYLYYNGAWQARTRGSYWESRYSSRAPIFYDTNDTFYYSNPSATSRINAVSAYGEIRSDENIIAYYDYSDIRWKENVKIIENAIDKVKQLDGITYNYIDREGEYTGVIAQQVEKVLPGVVADTTDMKTGKDRKVVRYGNMVGLLIEATKEQQKTIEKQQEEIDTLKEMVYNLMEKLNK